MYLSLNFYCEKKNDPNLSDKSYGRIGDLCVIKHILVYTEKQFGKETRIRDNKPVLDIEA